MPPVPPRRKTPPLLAPRDVTETARQGQGIGDLEAMRQMATTAIPEVLRNAPATSTPMSVFDMAKAVAERNLPEAGVAMAGLLPFGRIAQRLGRVAKTPLDELDELYKSAKFAPSDYSDAAQAWRNSPEGIAFDDKTSELYNRAEAYLDKAAERGMAAKPTITPVGQTPMVHGTTTENIKSLLTAGRLDPSRGTRVYGDLDWHRDVGYATSPKGAWIDPQRAANMRAAEYQHMVDLQAPSNARMMQVRTPEEAGSLLSLLGLNSRRDFWRIGDSPNAFPVGDPSEIISRQYADKIRNAGIDVVNLTGRGADALGTAPEQYVLFNPKSVRVIGERKRP